MSARRENVVTVYIHSGNSSRQTAKRTREVVKIFKKRGLSSADIATVDVKPYPELGQWLESQGAKNHYPLIFIGDVYIGFLEDLKTADALGKLEEHLEANYTFLQRREKREKNPISVGASSSWFNPFAWGVMNRTFGALKEFDSDSAGDSSELSGSMSDENLGFVAIEPTPDSDAEPAHNEVDIEVLRTNWLWRQQKRVLRFGEKGFSRIDPISKEIRAAHNYADVESVEITDDTNLIVRIASDSEPQYMRTQDKTTTDQIILLLTERAPSKRRIVITDRRLPTEESV